MAETCVLGHAWTPGRVLCAVCGFGPRALQPGAAAAAATPAAVTAEPELATAGASARMGRSLQLDEQAAVPSPHQEPAAPQLTLSPDGQWAWNGTEWVPAPPPPPETAPLADLLPEPAPRRSRRRRGKDAPEASAAADLPTREKTGRAAADPKLLILLVLVLAIAAAADFALKLPPLGHKAASTTTTVVPHGHPAGTVAAGRAVRASAAVDHDLARIAGAEAKSYFTSHHFVATPAVLRKDGATTTGGDRVLVAAKGQSYCAVVGKPASWYVLDSHFAGTLGAVAFATPAAAEATCHSELGPFSSL